MQTEAAEGEEEKKPPEEEWLISTISSIQKEDAEAGGITEEVRETKERFQKLTVSYQQ